MKALDKVFDTQVITGIIGDKFHSLRSKENFLYEEGKKTGKKRRYQSYNRYRKSTENLSSQSEWNIERCIKLQII